MMTNVNFWKEGKNFFFPTFILRDLAKRIGIVLTSIEVDTRRPSSDVPFLIREVSFTGTWNEVAGLLALSCWPSYILELGLAILHESVLLFKYLIPASRGQ